MTEQEAIEVITDKNTIIETLKCDDVAWTKLQPAIDTAISALEEIQQYRALGTVEEFKNCKNILNKSETEELAKIIDEWLLYHKIGTPEELREAKEKQEPKKPIDCVEKYLTGRKNYFCRCSCCDGVVDDTFDKYCRFCGQAIDWSDTKCFDGTLQ